MVARLIGCTGVMGIHHQDYLGGMKHFWLGSGHGDFGWSVGHK